MVTNPGIAGRQHRLLAPLVGLTIPDKDIDGTALFALVRAPSATCRRRDPRRTYDKSIAINCHRRTEPMRRRFTCDESCILKPSAGNVVTAENVGCAAADYGALATIFESRADNDSVLTNRDVVPRYSQLRRFGPAVCIGVQDGNPCCVPSTDDLCSLVDATDQTSLAANLCRSSQPFVLAS